MAVAQSSEQQKKKKRKKLIVEITNTKLTYARASDSRCWLYICSFFLRWLWLVGVVVGRHIFSSFTYLRYIYIFSLYIVLKAVRA